jgi:hypothetical protein
VDSYRAGFELGRGAFRRRCGRADSRKQLFADICSKGCLRRRRRQLGGGGGSAIVFARYALDWLVEIGEHCCMLRQSIDVLQRIAVGVQPGLDT